MRTRRLIIAALVGTAFADAATWSWIVVYDNYHNVVPKELYRSGQVSAAEKDACRRSDDSIVRLRRTCTSRRTHLPKGRPRRARPDERRTIARHMVAQVIANNEKAMYHGAFDRLIAKYIRRPCMIFHVTYEYGPEDRDDAQARFKATGALPPAGVTMLGRWHSAEGHAGYTVAEADSATAIAKWVQQWSDLLSFEIVPVLSDEEMDEVIG